jgi:hypothetical protein
VHCLDGLTAGPDLMTRFTASVAALVVFAQPPPSRALSPRDRPAAQNQTEENAKKRQKIAECKQQAEKLLSDAEKRTFMKECMSQ